MKKFKFLSMALVATAIVGCTSDDLNVAENYVLPGDGTEVLATINDPGLDGGSMRAAFATNVTGNISTISQKAYFSEGDEFKMYCTDTWKPQVYKFKQYAGIDAANAIDASVFTWADEDSKYNKKDENILSGREYGVFPADSFLFPDENRSVLEYHINNQISYGEQKGKGITGEARKLYNSLVPMFGFCVDDKITFNYMTSLLRVEMMGVTVDQPYTLVLTSDDSYYKMSGTFNSTVFDAADYTADDAHLPVFGMQKDSEVGDGEGYLAVTVTPKEADVAVYLPIPTGLYDVDKLKLYCVEKEIGDTDDLDTDMTTFLGSTDATTIYTRDTTAITLENPQGRKVANKINYPTGYNLGRGTYLLAVVGDALNVAGVKIKSLDDLNKIIKTYSTYERAVSIQVELDENITVKDVTEAIKIPQLKNDLTVKIVGTSKTISGTDGLQITNETGEETNEGFTATLDFASGIVAADVTCDVKQNITIGGTIAKAVAFNTAATVGLIGEYAYAGPVTITKAGKVVVDKDATVTVLNITNAPEVNVAGTVEQMNVEGTVKVVVTGKIGTDLTAKNDSKVTIETSGAAIIKSVTPAEEDEAQGKKAAEVTINAVWDEDTTEAIDDANANDGNIYTALQFAALKNTTTPSEVNLYANVTITDEEAEWTPLTGVTTFDGHGNTVKGLKIVGSETLYTNLGFLSTFNGTAIKDLTLDGLTVNVSSKSTVTSYNIGSLVGSASAGTISGVVVKGAKLNGNATTSSVGGLIGAATGAVTVAGADIDAAIKGYYNLGGIIGNIHASGVTVTLGYVDASDASKSTRANVAKTTTIEVVKEVTTAADDEAGKVALGVGSITEGSLDLVNFYYSGNSTEINTDNWYYNKLWFQIDKELMYFKGCTNGGKARYYLGYSPSATKVTLQGTELTNYYPGSGSVADKSKTNAFNVFEK